MSMSSLLDIDLDYFNEVDDPTQRLERLLEWADCPVSFIIRSHHVALRRWKACLQERGLPDPQHILHVDEHHDMMDENPAPNIANFLYHAMRTWPQVRVHWLVQHPIDSPSMCLSDESWRMLRDRFTRSPHRPRDWPKPHVVSVCTSPRFIPEKRREELIEVIENWQREWSAT